eukprot:UN32341
MHYTTIWLNFLVFYFDNNFIFCKTLYMMIYTMGTPFHSTNRQMIKKHNSNNFPKDNFSVFPETGISGDTSQLHFLQKFHNTSSLCFLFFSTLYDTVIRPSKH